MANGDNGKCDRRDFLKHSTVAAALATGLGIFTSCQQNTAAAKKVIILGIDGMDPNLSERLMDAGMLPNFDKLRKLGGYRRLGTSNPPLSPVAWADFMTGAGPGTHGIFDFFHRDLRNPYNTRSSVSSLKPGKGVYSKDDYWLPIPFKYKPPEVVLRRKALPFWEYLDEAGISSQIYMIPSNFPPSRSEYGNHKSLSGMGTPDIMGEMSVHQYFVEGAKKSRKKEPFSIVTNLVFNNDSAQAELIGPVNTFQKKPKPATIKFTIYRDSQAKGVAIEIQKHKILLKEGSWSKWIDLDFVLTMPDPIPDNHISGICRLYMQNVKSPFRLYVSPININPLDPAMPISEPSGFSKKMARHLGLFATLGLQEDYSARLQNKFNDKEFFDQANMVLDQRLKMLEYAIDNYKEGVLFFYFSSIDMQSHIFWWDSSEKHPSRSYRKAKEYHNQIEKLYIRMDDVLGDILKRYDGQATIIALSDHGFAGVKKSFDLNLWLRANGYIYPSNCTTLNDRIPPGDLRNVGVNWPRTTAYGLGHNGLYINLKGRETKGIVGPTQREKLLTELTAKLEALQDENGKPVIRKVYRADRIYSGPQTKNAPDLIIGLHRGYRIDSKSAEGNIGSKMLMDNTTPWSADHCFDPREIPGVLFCNRVVTAKTPRLIDLAPSILGEFGLGKPAVMEGQNVFA